jgi:hypothetical protein
MVKNVAIDYQAIDAQALRILSLENIRFRSLGKNVNCSATVKAQT